MTGFMFDLARHNRSAPVAAARFHNGNPQNPRSASTRRLLSKGLVDPPVFAVFACEGWCGLPFRALWAVGFDAL